jgi:putative ABC transport system permease protein
MLKRTAYTIGTALDSLRTHATRSLLTILGIVIGVAAIIIIMALGKSAEELILREVNQMGADTVVVLPGGDFMEETALFSESLTERGLSALKRGENVPNLDSIMPIVVVPGSITYLGESFRPSAMLGAEAEFFGEVFDVYPSEGMLFTDVDIQSRARVVIIGSKVKEELFGSSDALGERVTIRNNQFRVVGVYAPMGQRGLFDVDTLVIMPHTTAQAYLTGTSHYHRFIIRADSKDNVEKVSHDVRATLRETYGIEFGEEEDFQVVTQEGLIEQISLIIGALTAFLTSAVAVALVVGGIGVMNIMLVSVTERTREIGLRKAVGATRGTITTQFLLEAVVLTLVGGGIGILFGTLVAWGASHVLTSVLSVEWVFTFPADAAVLGVAASAAVGVIFGLYPARQAAKKSPIEALRYE